MRTTQATAAANTVTLDPALFDATGKAPPIVVALPPAWDPFGSAPPMTDADYDRWLDQRDRERQFSADGGR